jgi:hypothetical protein
VKLSACTYEFEEDSEYVTLKENSEGKMIATVILDCHDFASFQRRNRRFDRFLISPNGRDSRVGGVKCKSGATLLAGDSLRITSAIVGSMILALTRRTEGKLLHRSADAIIGECSLNGIARAADSTALEGIAMTAVGRIAHLPGTGFAGCEIGCYDGKQIADLTFLNGKGGRTILGGYLLQYTRIDVQIDCPPGRRRQKALDKTVQCLPSSEGAHSDAAADIPHISRDPTRYCLAADEGAVAHPLHQST